jgi:MYXO-CTERM domain-containing protein
MTSKTSIIVISAFAILMSSAVTLKAQTPPDQTPPADPPTVTRDVDRDVEFDWGWLGLLGLLGLGGLAGRRDRDVVTTRRV